MHTQLLPLCKLETLEMLQWALSYFIFNIYFIYTRLCFVYSSVHDNLRTTDRILLAPMAIAYRIRRRIDLQRLMDL